MAAVPAAWAGGDGMRAPREERDAPMRSTGPSGAALEPFMRFFRTTISPVDGDRCPMYPTCSQYGEEAFRKHGSILGLLLVVDRLFHEWSETALAPVIHVHGVKRYWDPLEANDSWFVSPAPSHPSATPRPRQP
jgi:putative component of membrane protein insertase Oxa1/YidC/SpoIIIJ protein YidD